jgi:hypothetical protein
METSEWTYEQTKGILTEGRMEGMISSIVKTRFESVLRDRHLSDPSRFTEPDFFDEVPLYARYKEVEFLKDYGDGNVDLQLIELSLDYLERVTSETPPSKSKRFVAITIIRDDDEYIVPSIFVCNRDVAKRLKELHLSLPTKGLGKQIKNLVKDAGFRNAYTILEDTHTVTDDVRVFIGHKSPPPGLVAIKEFANGAVQLHR